MPPKKGKKGKKGKKKKQKDPNALTQVDKTFYELEISDLNRKLARLRSLTAELEEKNDELTKQLAQLDEDRNDIIAYLKKTLQEKLNEINDIKERLLASEQKRNSEIEEYEKKIAELTDEYNQMHETLTSEIKLLEGKLNSLEEFRSQRDDLMRKFEQQEIAMEEQEKRHKQQLYETEKKFIIAKQQLKNDMELRLVQLSQEFHESTELRIAATTHRVIRENVSINNELETMYVSNTKLKEDTLELKQKITKLLQIIELKNNDKKIALDKVNVQMDIINKLTKEYNELKSKMQYNESLEENLYKLTNEFKEQQQKCDKLEYDNRILQQNLENSLDRENVLKTDYQFIENDYKNLSNILFEAMASIKEALRLYPTDEESKESQRYKLLSHLFKILTECEKRKGSKHSLQSIPSISKTYVKGDLGFVPKPIDELRPKFVETQHTRETQVGASFDEFVTVDRVEAVDEVEESSRSSSEKTDVRRDERMSAVFFDDNIIDESLLEEEEDDADEIERRRQLLVDRSKSRSSAAIGDTDALSQGTDDYLDELTRAQFDYDEMSIEPFTNIVEVSSAHSGSDTIERPPMTIIEYVPTDEPTEGG